MSQSPAGATRFRALSPEQQAALSGWKDVSIPRRGYAVPRHNPAHNPSCVTSQCLNPPQGLRGSAPPRKETSDVPSSDTVSIPRRGYAVPRRRALHARQEEDMKVSIPRRGYAVPRPPPSSPWPFWPWLVSIPRRGYAVPRLTERTSSTKSLRCCLNPPQGLRGSAPVLGPEGDAYHNCLNPPQGLRGSAPKKENLTTMAVLCLNPPQGLRGSAPGWTFSLFLFACPVSIPRRGYAVPRLLWLLWRAIRRIVSQSPAGATRFRAKDGSSSIANFGPVSIPRRGYAVPRRSGWLGFVLSSPMSQSPAGATRFRAIMTVLRDTLYSDKVSIPRRGYAVPRPLAHARPGAC